jgi:hypothetical protein
VPNANYAERSNTVNPAACRSLSRGSNRSPSLPHPPVFRV